MYFKIKESILETRSGYIEADSIEEAKRMFNEGEYELDDDDNESTCVSSILYKTGEDADLEDIEDLSCVYEIDEWDAIDGYNDIDWRLETEYFNE